MICQKNRIVVVLGAGFPMPWGAPSSDDLKTMLTDYLKTTSLFFLTEYFLSFEDLVAALYSCVVSQTDNFHQVLFNIKAPKEADLTEAASIYRECINKVMKRILAYEENCCNSHNEERNQNLRLLFKELRLRYRHVSVYTTNYDIILPLILGWSDETMSLRGEAFIYDPLAQHSLRQSYSNLHGSIHLEMTRFGGHQYEVSHNLCFFPQVHLLENYGGNPYESNLFTPIIVGHNKTQQILSKHFSFATTCFANDLSDCETFLAIGGSFSDPHINALIKQYTKPRHVCYRLVTLEDLVCGSSLENNVSSQIIGYNTPYVPDTLDDSLFIRENGQLVYYKRGTDSFLADTLFWRDYL